MILPREYQTFALDAWVEWMIAQKGNPLLLYPTGVGKSIILALLMEYVVKKWGRRCLLLTHSKELIDQDFKKLKQWWPMAPAGIYCEGLKRREYWHKITIGSIQTVYNMPEHWYDVDFIFVDEAHLLSPKDQTMYRKFISAIKAKNPHLTVTGLTATGWRRGQGWLWMGDNALFDGAAVDACGVDAFNWFVDEGFLVPPIPRKTKFQYDTSNIRTQGGEFHKGDVERETNKKELNERCVIAMLDDFADARSSIVFVNGIKQVEAVADIISAYGIRVTYVHSDMKDKERDDRIEDYKNFEYDVMVNNGILTTGFDHPALDFMGMMKLTRESSLFGQMLGRGTRPFYADGHDLTTKEGRLASILESGKLCCKVADFAKNSERLGPINDPVIPIPGKRLRVGEAPIRICDECGSYNHASAPTCIACGYEFPRRDKFNDESSGKALVKRSKNAPAPIASETKEPELITFEIGSVNYMIHNKPGKPPSLKVIYKSGIRTFYEWIHFESIGGARNRAVSWWMKRTGCTPAEVPKTTKEALANNEILRVPLKIGVLSNSKYHEVRDYEFET